ncbi:F-box only protein 15-like [Clavelina lepadiformis]|uniref:F-box only protein 15-like n=1 Tax=Clavelina lepadiformis TaxID=159417 RepID=UPI00404348AC
MKKVSNPSKLSSFYEKYTGQSNRKKNHFPVKRKHKLCVSDLPDEIIVKIFAFLDIDNLLQVTCVCRKWKHLSEDSLLWHDTFKRFFDVGVNTAYSKLMKLTLSDTKREFDKSSVSWKREFFNHCRTRNQRLLSNVKIDPYAGVTLASDIFEKYHIKFQLLIKDKQDRDHYFPMQSSCQRNPFKASILLQCHSLHSFPPLKSIKSLSIFAVTALVLGHGCCPVQGSPTKLGLVKCESLLVDAKERELADIASDDQIEMHKTPGGFLVGSWKGTDDPAIIYAPLLCYNLVQKSFFSTRERIFSPAHRVVLDDIDPRYGLHGYTCYLHLHSSTKTLWQDKFSHLSSNESVEDGLLIMAPDSSCVGPFKLLSWRWKTELFSGLIKNLAVLDIVVKDCNKDVIWAASSPVTSQSISSSKLSFEQSGPLMLVHHEDDCGIVTVTYATSTDGFPSVPSIKICLKASKINQWFGTKY